MLAFSPNTFAWSISLPEFENENIQNDNITTCVMAVEHDF
jgi:hypothetical protein